MEVKSYLQKHARKLDLYFYEHLFEGADAKPVLTQLVTYQNSDGGFGKALEPDLRLPDSSALATTIALQYISQIDKISDRQVIESAIRYLLSLYDETVGWINIPSAADNYPRAPWWNHKDVKVWAEWGNPSAEILGYLLVYAYLVKNRDLLQTLSERAVSRIKEIKEPEQHEIKCFVRLYENAGKELQSQLYEPLAKQVKQVTQTNPQDWKGYAVTPLTFVTSPDSPFADVFDKKLLLQNIEHIQEQMIDDSHWEPTWEWGQFEDIWTKAKMEWSGKLTVENFKLLRVFGKL